MQVSPAQIRGARAMLGWSLLDLAKEAGVSVVAVRRAEEIMPEAVAADTMRAALEKAGVRFLTEGDGSVGVMLEAP